MTDNPKRSRPTIDTTVPSPCIGFCTLTADNICAGCLRSQDEIRDWVIMSREEKLATIERTKQRSI